MKTNLVTLSLSAVFLLTISCADSLEYRYANKEDTIACNNAPINTDLYKEALYSFEDYIDQINNKQTNRNFIQGYNVFIGRTIANQGLETSKVSEHDIRIFNALKKEKDLWVNDNGTYRLNYNSDLVTCIADNILDEALQTTFKALIETNSMNTRLFVSPLRSKMGAVLKDKFLATYIALDMFYSQFFTTDFSNVELIPDDEKFPKESDLPKTPPSATPSKSVKPLLDPNKVEKTKANQK
ncbi:MAG: hypothetical protein KJP09_03935 [Bacteroidia bacterium]|nr:hypothetical protein [Bacteroidia bacterium]MBT8311069.1 hypothetical protein [Bacteroidia bacterium]NND09993.1 hypothetical protein [Flavobacteriaceae bacterium]NNK26704.1 hypothetical protein [Flavobacteriaceae bacterium]NNL61801.1 hypothetical protein [Flavobacteriaceae bacterium]